MIPVITRHGRQAAARPPLSATRLAFALALAVTFGACGDAQPRPIGSEAPSASGDPAPSARPTGDPALGPGPGLPLVADRATAMWGLYANDRVSVTAGEHAAWLQAAMPCAEVLQMLAAGEWSVGAQLAIPIVAPGSPGASEAHWILLERGDASVFAQLGGDAGSCGGRLTRSSVQEVEASGTHDWRGAVVAGQLSCMAAAGQAEVVLLLTGERFGALLHVAAPLRVGTHELTIEDEVGVGIGAGVLSLRGYLEAMEAAVARGEADEVDLGVGEGFAPGESFEGEVVVTSVDPLVGEIRLTGLVDERERRQAVTSGFRCDLPPGRLTAAAGQEPPATPSPTPSAPPGAVDVVIIGGRHAGTYSASGGELTCSHGLMQDGEWFVTWSRDGEAGPDEIALVQLSVPIPEAGGSSDVPEATIVVGASGDLDSFLTIGSTFGGGRTGSATSSVTRSGEGAELWLEGTTEDGVRLEVRIACGRLEQF